MAEAESKANASGTAAGYANNNLIGFNLTDNQCIDPDHYNENAIWIDGQIHLLPAIKVDRPDGVMGVWNIRDKEGRVKLDFFPKIQGNVEFNYGLAESKYHGPFGDFEGYLINNKDEKISFQNFFGMGEQFFLRI